MPFERRSVAGAAASGAVAISNVRLFDVDGDKRLDILASEMRTGPVLLGLAKDAHALKPIARLNHPAHIEPVDLDKDGRGDFLVADLGSFQPADHSDGAVYWLRGRADGSYVTVPLATKLPRTSDARAADFDGDGDLDVIVGSFGWRTTGNVTLLENRTTDWKTPAFAPKVIDPRTGAIHVPTIDIDKDGKPDFIALLAQQHESVIAFVNRGKGLEFTPQIIYEAPHPNWGSSGIDLVDLDKDGDMDVLLTHGDTFDDFVLKPYHGVIWLENTGTFPFVEHRLATLPGAQRAQAADLDGDGDLDIVASAFVSGEASAHAGVAGVAGADGPGPLRAAHARDRARRRTRRSIWATSTATASRTSSPAGSRSARASARGPISGGTNGSSRADRATAVGGYRCGGPAAVCAAGCRACASAFSSSTRARIRSPSALRFSR